MISAIYQYRRCRYQILCSILNIITHLQCFWILQAVEKLVQGAESGCPSEKEKQVVLNCCRILTRILPYIFEDQDWRGFFWSTVPGAGRAGVSWHGKRKISLSQINIVYPWLYGRKSRHTLDRSPVYHSAHKAGSGVKKIDSQIKICMNILITFSGFLNHL